MQLADVALKRIILQFFDRSIEASEISSGDSLKRLLRGSCEYDEPALFLFGIHRG